MVNDSGHADLKSLVTGSMFTNPDVADLDISGRYLSVI
jgi:hypothetical protein